MLSKLVSALEIRDDAPMTATSSRARVRAEITREILEAGRARLAEHGAAGLSLRAVARDVGMVSSAVYRYFPSRDHLLTALIVDAYDSLGAAVERAVAKVPGEDLFGRWRAICDRVRRWARAHPHEYALIYGSPVPGYRAPVTTIGPATRVALILVQLLVDADDADALAPASLAGPVPPGLRGDLDRLARDVRRRAGSGRGARARRVECAVRSRQLRAVRTVPQCRRRERRLLRAPRP